MLDRKTILAAVAGAAVTVAVYEGVAILGTSPDDASGELLDHLANP